MCCTGYEMARYKGTQAIHLHEKSMHTLCVKYIDTSLICNTVNIELSHLYMYVGEYIPRPIYPYTYIAKYPYSIVVRVSIVLLSSKVSYYSIRTTSQAICYMLSITTIQFK